MNQPLDKGRAVVIAERYETIQVDPQTGQPIMKNRYASVGRATMWPAKEGTTTPKVDIEIDTLPVGHTGPIKVMVFWDSEQKGQGQPQQNAPQQGYPGQQPQYNNNQYQGR